MNDLREKNLANFKAAGGEEDGAQVIFPEILEGIDKLNSDGSICLFPCKEHKNILMWSEVSGDSIATINSLVSDGILALFWVTSPILYLTGGRILRLPIAKKAKDYKSHHWAPTVFVKGPNYFNYSREI